MIETAPRCARELDRLPSDQGASREPADPAPILGEWQNTNRSTWGVSQVELRRQAAGIDLNVIAADPLGEPHDWGWAVVDKLFTDGPGSSRPCGYTAAFDLGHARTQIQANTNHGLTVVTTLTAFTDGSGRASYLTREFFFRRPARVAPAHPHPGPVTTTGPAVARGDDRLPMLTADIDPAPLLCRWRNADETTRGIADISGELRQGQVVVRVVAVGREGPVDWGEGVATLYSDISTTGGGRATADPATGGRPTPHYADLSATDAGPAFGATFDHGFQRVHLQARVYLGVLVVAAFTEFTDDSGRQNYFHREFFVREG